MQKQTFSTKDISLAAYLQIKGFTSEGTDEEEGVTFILFDKTPSLLLHRELYMTGRAEVNPLAYSQAMRSLLRFVKNK